MEILYFLSTICLILFMILATYDGFYLHIFKYELFNHSESHFEHKIHTVRAILFPIIVWFLFIDTTHIGFWIAIIAIVMDVIVLGIDAYYEKDSRTFMGGLPTFEYIIHLFANSFHFAAIILIIASKIAITNNEVSLILLTNNSFGGELIQFVAINIIPGAVVLGIIHVLLSFHFGKANWNNLRRKITCC